MPPSWIVWDASNIKLAATSNSFNFEQYDLKSCFFTKSLNWRKESKWWFGMWYVDNSFTDDEKIPLFCGSIKLLIPLLCYNLNDWFTFEELKDELESLWKGRANQSLSWVAQYFQRGRHNKVCSHRLQREEELRAQGKREEHNNKCEAVQVDLSRLRVTFVTHPIEGVLGHNYSQETKYSRCFQNSSWSVAS